MNKWKSMFLLSVITMVIAGCASIPIGDDQSIKLNKDGITIKSSDGSGESIDIVTKDGEVTYSGTNAQGEQFQQSVSTGQKLPADFPADIPIPADVELSIIDSEFGEETQYIVNFTIKGEVIDYYNQYRKYVEQAGYSQIIDASNGNAASDTVIENIMAKSDEETLMISIMKSGTGKFDDGTISVSFMYMF